MANAGTTVEEKTRKVIINDSAGPSLELRFTDIQRYQDLHVFHGVEGNDQALAPLGTLTFMVKRTRTFRVNQSIVLSPNFSPFLARRYRATLNASSQTVSQTTSQQVENLDSLEIILREAHAARDASLLQVGIGVIWGFFNVARLLEVDKLMLKDWVSLWFEMPNQKQKASCLKMKEMVEWARMTFNLGIWFDNAIAFKEATHTLMYNATENIPLAQPYLTTPVPGSYLEGDMYRE